jgi:hypothetical protein
MMMPNDELIAELRSKKWMVNCEMRGLIPDDTAERAAQALAAQNARIAEQDRELKRAKIYAEEAYQVDSEIIAGLKARIAELGAVVSLIANSKNVSANGFRIWAKGLCKNALK